MAQRARLITPQGKKIDLPPAVYRQVRQLLHARGQRHSQRKIDQVIKSTYGKYAGGRSLTQALLAERTAETSPESEKIKRVQA